MYHPDTVASSSIRDDAQLHTAFALRMFHATPVTGKTGQNRRNADYPGHNCRPLRISNTDSSMPRFRSCNRVRKISRRANDHSPTIPCRSNTERFTCTRSASINNGTTSRFSLRQRRLAPSSACCADSRRIGCDVALRLSTRRCLQTSRLQGV